VTTSTTRTSPAPGAWPTWPGYPWLSTPGHDFAAIWRYLTDALKERAAAFGKPVVLVHGDTHVFRIDNPWPDVPNFTRVETHGLAADAANWVRARVDPSDPKVFTFTTEHAG
jgi:hypothetical protein